MVRRLLAVTGLLLPLAVAAANGAALGALKRQNMSLELAAETCVLNGRTVLALSRSQSDTRESEKDLAKCIADGKEQAKAAHAEVKAALKAQKVPPEVIEWRLEWIATFDSALLGPGDTEGQYLRRAQEAQAKVKRASNKVEIALE